MTIPAILNQQRIGALFANAMPDPQPRTGIALGVHIHDQNTFFNGGQSGGQIDGGGGFAHPPLLIGQGQNFKMTGGASRRDQFFGYQTNITSYCFCFHA